MNNLQLIYQLFNETTIFAITAISIFFVFLCGITKSLLYLTSESASYLFDASEISHYISKTISPEPVRLKILFLPLPQFEKRLLSDYLKEPIQKPSQVFQGTLEELKCEILSITNYNKSVAMFFFLLSGVAILSSQASTIDIKLAGVLSVAVVLFSLYWFCTSVYVLLKYISYKSFKTAISKLDDFHSAYSMKYRCGLLPEQTKVSPFLKTAMETLKTAPCDNKESKYANFQTIADIPEIKKVDATEKETSSFKPICISQNQSEVSEISMPKSDVLLSKPKIESTCDIKTLLEQIKTATENLDFEYFESLSAHLSDVATSPNLSLEDHRVLQAELDKYLAEFRGASV